MENYEKLRKENKHKDMTKLFLEASLNKKVENADIQFFNPPGNMKDKSMKTMSYKVWLYSPEVLKDATISLGKSDNFPGRNSQNFPKIVKCSLGQIILEDLKKNNLQYAKENSIIIESGVYKIVLAEILVGKFQSFMINEDVDLETLDVNTLTLPEEKNDVYYLSKHSSPENLLSPDVLRSKHIFAVRDFKKLIYLSVVIFKTDNESIKCDVCSESKDDQRYIYCHNDEKYFCAGCDEDHHIKKNSKVFQKHKKTVYTNFSITHQNTCTEHPLKPFEFYCGHCQSVFCIKCLLEGEHKNFTHHEVKYLNDVFNSFELESKSLTERAKQINTGISHELDIKEKSAKDFHKLIADLEAKIKETRKNLIEEVEIEAMTRTVYLASIQSEVSRLLMELDAKVTFIKNQYTNSDHSTYISMSNVFIDYIKKDLIHHFEMITNNDFEKFRENILIPNEKDEQKKKNRVQFAQNFSEA